MNRRQSAAVYVVGVLLAAISAYHGEQDGEWLFASFLPVLMLGTLVVYALRDKANATTANQVLKSGLGLAMAVIAFASALGEARDAKSDIARLEPEVDLATSSAEEARGEAEEAKREAEEAKNETEDLESRLSELEVALGR